MTGDLEFDYGGILCEEFVIDEPASVTARILERDYVWNEVE